MHRAATDPLFDVSTLAAREKSVTLAFLSSVLMFFLSLCFAQVPEKGFITELPLSTPTVNPRVLCPCCDPFELHEYAVELLYTPQ